ncbi:MAG: hypothetical protein K0R93_1383 [Anaerosolibacter sp.]|jgi:prepilin-type N-terminal cleavage/methylation domain-containing protein|uniref:type IV pilus modification PilV family protein n=1 Tax=Anaerosolibacter sp. TaxID=1872527 RepID=UPI0026027991|nr:type II secretion system protein [Anaerosolibacter sp.]MDF2546485.1 hypothetical protein [Anaerosolibacter sp.]
MEKKMDQEKGMTLIEVIIALCIMGILFVPISSMFLSTVKLLQEAKQLMIYSHLSQQYMERSKYDLYVGTGLHIYDIEALQLRVEVSIEPLERANNDARLEKIQLIVKDIDDTHELSRMVGLRRRN